jgi:hypothetical protein
VSEVGDARKNNLPKPSRFEELDPPRPPATAASGPDQSKFTAAGTRAPLSLEAQKRQAELLRRMAAEHR